MGYLYYLLPAAVTFLMALQSFLKDRNAPSSPFNCFFVGMMGLLWPLTLPFILGKKLQTPLASAVEFWRSPMV